MQEILTIQVRTTEFLDVKGSRAEALMITFDGTCDCENFKGKILPGGVDREGKACHIFIENNGVASEKGMVEKTTPRIITDSECLNWMETADLSGTITPWEKGVIIHIFAKECDCKY